MKEILDYGITIFSTVWSIDNIDTILGIILLILSIANIIYKAVLSIIDLIKTKQYDKIDDVIEDVIEDIEEINDKRGEK